MINLIREHLSFIVFVSANVFGTALIILPFVVR